MELKYLHIKLTKYNNYSVCITRVNICNNIHIITNILLHISKYTITNITNKKLHNYSAYKNTQA